MHNSNHEAHHVTPISTYAKTFGVLVVLMLLTVWASEIRLGSLANNLVAMAIAVTKAVLVILFFMGVKYGTKLIKVWAALGFIWFTLILGILADHFTRGFEQVRGWEAVPSKSFPRQGTDDRQTIDPLAAKRGGSTSPAPDQTQQN